MKSVTNGCVLMLALAAGAAHAQTYPARPVRFIVPQAPGGASDVLSRIVAQKLTEQWPQQVVVDNRVGAGGNIGTELTAKAAPDGYTWVLGFPGTHAINPVLDRKSTRLNSSHSQQSRMPSSA